MWSAIVLFFLSFPFFYSIILRAMVRMQNFDVDKRIKKKKEQAKKNQTYPSLSPRRSAQRSAIEHHKKHKKHDGDEDPASSVLWVLLSFQITSITFSHLHLAVLRSYFGTASPQCSQLVTTIPPASHPHTPYDTWSSRLLLALTKSTTPSLHFHFYFFFSWLAVDANRCNTTHKRNPRWVAVYLHPAPPNLPSPRRTCCVAPPDLPPSAADSTS